MKNLLARSPAFAAILLLASIPAVAQSSRTDAAIQRIEINAQAIEAFDPREPQKNRFGRLTFRGGLVLDSKHRDFGGLSALHLEPDGARFLALTDRGHWLRGRIVYRGRAPVALADTELAPVLGADGRPLLRRRGWHDTEALALTGGIAYVGLERVHAILRFDYARDGLRARGRAVAVPPAFKSLPNNRGIECLAAPAAGTLAGSLIAISERGLDAQGNVLGFVIGGGGFSFTVKRSDEFDITDCALTPDGGRLLVLERRFSWTRGVAMRIRSVTLASIRPGAVVDGPELISADMAYQVDNMEGMAVHRDASGAMVLTLVSDDNFSPLQRTLLLQFAWEGE